MGAARSDRGILSGPGREIWGAFGCSGCTAQQTIPEDSEGYYKTNKTGGQTIITYALKRSDILDFDR